MHYNYVYLLKMTNPRSALYIVNIHHTDGHDGIIGEPQSKHWPV